MAIQIKKAEKAKRKLRLALVGVSKSGKTLTALKFARALVGPQGKVGVIDTEGGNSQFYVGADEVGDFDIIILEDFNPVNYIEAMKAFEKAGYDAIVQDSLSHAWIGKGGCLEIVDGASGASKFQSGWGKATPLHNELISAINQCKTHVIATMRQKADYVLETNSQGKTVPKKVGMAAVQREGMEYEFDMTATMVDAVMCVDGIRGTELESLVGKTFKKPGAEFIEMIRDSLNNEKPVVVPASTPAPKPAKQPAEPSETYMKAKGAILGAKDAAAVDKLAATIEQRISQKAVTDEQGIELLQLCETRKAELSA